MAQEFRHKRYFQLQHTHNENGANETSPTAISDGTTKGVVTFSSAASAVKDYFNFQSVWNTNSPTVSYALEDSNKTLVVTYEFDNASDEAGWVTAVNTAYGNGSAFGANTDVKHIKTEWYNASGVETTATDII